MLIKKVDPKYPDKARNQHVQGTVVLRAVIGATGDISELDVLSGDKLLVPSALKAVKQWKYRPYLLQGHPVEVDTTITVNFCELYPLPITPAQSSAPPRPGLAKQQHGRSLIHVSQVFLAISAEANGGNPGEDGSVLVAPLFTAKLEGAQDAMKVDQS